MKLTTWRGAAAWVVLAQVVTVLPAGALEAQRQGGDEDAYLGAVAQYFSVTPEEVSILREWDMPVDEVPVVLFVARRAGVPSDVVVAVRDGGASWSDVSRRFGLDARAYYVALNGGGGSLADVYDRYRETPERERARMPLQDTEIVGLVNLRVLSRHLAVAPSDVVRARDTAGGYVAGYARLHRGRP